MIGSRLKEVLKHLCSNNGWSYGIFWRVNRQDPTFLAVEEAYSEEQIKRLIYSMVQHVHMLGEGIIGEAAITGNHQWILADTYSGEWGPTGSVDNQNVFQAFQGNSQIHLQLSSGIKTIAIIPVVPIGVVQFGSFDKVMERSDFVDQIRSLFRQPENAGRILFSGKAPGLNNETYHPSGPGKAPALNNETYHPSGFVDSVVSSGTEGSNYWNVKASHGDHSDKLMERTQPAIVPSHSSPFTEGLQSDSLTSIINTTFLNLRKRFETTNAGQAISPPPGLQIHPASSSAEASASRYPTLSTWATNLTAFERQPVSGRGQQETSNTLSENPNRVSCINTFQNFQRDAPSASYSPSELLNNTNSRLEVNRSEVEASKGPTSLHRHPEANPVTDLSQEIYNRLIERINGNLSPTFVASNPSNLGLGNPFSRIPVNDANNALQNSTINTRNSLGLVGNVEQGTSTLPMQLFSDDDLFEGLGSTFDHNQEMENWEDIILSVGSGSQSNGTSEGVPELDVGSIPGPQKGFVSEFGLLDGITNRPSSENQLSTTPVTCVENASTYSNQVHLAGLPSLGGTGDEFNKPSLDNHLSTTPVTGAGNASTYCNQVQMAGFPSLGGTRDGFNRPSSENHLFTTPVTGERNASTYSDQVQMAGLPSLGGTGDGFNKPRSENHLFTTPVTGAGNASTYSNQVQMVGLPSLGGTGNGFNRPSSENYLSTTPITGAGTASTNSNQIQMAGLPSLGGTGEGLHRPSSQNHLVTTPVTGARNASTYSNQVQMVSLPSSGGTGDGFNRPSLENQVQMVGLPSLGGTRHGFNRPSSENHLTTTPITSAGNASTYSNQIQMAGLPSLGGTGDGLHRLSSENHLVTTSVTGARNASTYSNQVQMANFPSLCGTGDRFNGPSLENHLFTTPVTGPGNASTYSNQVQMAGLPSLGGTGDGFNIPSSDNHLSTTLATGARSASTYNNQVQLAGLPSVGGAGDGLLPNCDPQRTTMHGNSLQNSQLDVWIGDSLNPANVVNSQPKNPDEPPKTTKKRARPGESTRPRPKDRQLIQDRLKELRELIPNGVKCSIDGLLEHSVKYTIFLESVVKYAEKLKKTDEPKMTGNASGVFMKDKSSGDGVGATWAFEVGGETIFCPVRVEDLNGSGLLLIEMLCEDEDVLKIVDIIRGFGLTIINGITERKENKIWLRYLVENTEILPQVKNNVSRMDVFFSLVQFLQEQQTGALNSDDQPSNIVESAIAVANYQQSSVPLTTGFPDRFQ